MKNHKNLEAWKLSKSLALEVYRLTERMPIEERYGLVSQMRRASVSIAANIAEGAGRRSGDDEFARYVQIASGSANELETLIDISRDLNYIPKDSAFDDRLDHLLRMLSSLLSVLKSSSESRVASRAQR